MQERFLLSCPRRHNSDFQNYPETNLCLKIPASYGKSSCHSRNLARLFLLNSVETFPLTSVVNKSTNLRLPETAGLALPETYEEAIDLDTKTYSLLKTEDDSESEFAPVDYNEAEMNAQFENLDFENYEMRYSAYDE